MCKLQTSYTAKCKLHFSDGNLPLQHGKVCTPVIAPNGGIKLGESALCPEVSNIYKSEAAIIQDIRQCTCQKCEIAWDNLKKVHPTAYYLCGGK